VTHAGYVVVNNKLYLCSGYVGANDGPSTNQCLVLDISKPRGQQWSSIAPLPGIGQAGGGLVYDSTKNALFYAGGAARAVGSKATID
jgi:Kelch motif